MGRFLGNVRSNWLTVAFLAIVIGVAGVQVANPHSYVSEVVARLGENAAGQDAPLRDLTSIEQLQSTFNHDAGHPRLLLLLSPT